MKIIIVCIFSLVLLSSTVFAEPKIEFEGRYWIAGLSSHAKVTENSVIGTDMDLEDDLGVGDDNLPEARLIWNIGPNSMLRAAYTQVSYGGDKNIEKTIYFNGNTYALGTNVSTDLDVDYFRLGWAWQFLNIGDDKVKAGPLLEVKAFMVDMSLDAPSIGVSEAEDFIIALPTFGGIVDIDIGEKFSLFAEASGLPSADYGHFFDTEIGIKFIPLKNFTIVAGYRVIDIELEDDDSYGELDMKGPFFGATFRF
ncbi:MAG: hypothetical protein ABIA97_05480 [Candidatus Omnitrophota bacterium]